MIDASFPEPNNTSVKGIILSGGAGTRLYPITHVWSATSFCRSMKTHNLLSAVRPAAVWDSGYSDHNDVVDFDNNRMILSVEEKLLSLSLNDSRMEDDSFMNDKSLSGSRILS